MTKRNAVTRRRVIALLVAIAVVVGAYIAISQAYENRLRQEEAFHYEQTEDITSRIDRLDEKFSRITANATVHRDEILNDLDELRKAFERFQSSQASTLTP